MLSGGCTYLIIDTELYIIIMRMCITCGYLDRGRFFSSSYGSGWKSGRVNQIHTNISRRIVEIRVLPKGFIKPIPKSSDEHLIIFLCEF